MRRFTLVLAAATAALALSGAARADSLADDFDGTDTLARTEPLGEADHAGAGQGAGQDRLMIVDGNRGRVIYDDGRNDLYCVTRRYTAAYDYDGRPIRRRSMNCR